MSKKTKIFLPPKRSPKKSLVQTTYHPPHNTPKNDRKVHSLNNAVVLYYYPRQTLTKGLYFEFRSDNPSPTSHC